MKRASLICSVLYMVVLFRNAVVLGQDRWTQPGASRSVPAGYSAPTRGLFGLPMPQQWSGARPAGVQRYGQYDGMTGIRSNCPNGQCGPGVARGASQSGYLPAGSCPNGICSTANGGCVGGNCSAGGCVNGQCSTGYCPNGQCQSGAAMRNRCPGGICPQGLNSGWNARSTQMAPADPFRSVRPQDLEWTSSRRSGLSTTRDTRLFDDQMRDRFDLRSEYFNDEPLRDSLSGRDLRPSTDDWSRPTSRRSLEVPVDVNREQTRI